MKVGDRVSSLRVSSTLLERIERREKDIKENPMIVKKSTLPVLGRGKAGTPSVTIAAKGQVSFSPAASKALAELPVALIGWDETKRIMSVQGFKAPPKNYTAEDCFTLGYQKKSHSAYFSASALLQDKDTNIGYDYKSSGNQTFNVNVDTDKHQVSWVMPKGSVAPKPVTPRKKKESAVTPATAMAAAASANEVVVEEDDA